MPEKAVVFDLYGTLVPTFPGGPDRKDLPAMAAELGIDPGEMRRAWRSVEGKDLALHGGIDGEIRNALANIGIEVDEERLRRAAEARTACTRETIVPRPDAVPTLQRIADAGLRLALLSNCSAEVPGLVAETAMAPFFDPAVYSSDVHRKKPDPAFYQVALDGLGLEGKDCVFVGDGYGNELTGATAMGMRAIHIAVPGEPTLDIPEYEGRDWTGERVAALSEIPGLLGLP